MAAAAAYKRTAGLTTEDEKRAARLYGAACNAWTSGQSTHARHLAEAARTDSDDRLLRADIDRLRGRIEVNIGSAAQAYRIFTSAARAVASDDPARALEMRVAATLTHQFDGAATVLPTELLPLTPPPSPRDNPRERCLTHLLAATTADTAGRLTDARKSHAAAKAVSSDVDELDVLANLGNAALHLGDDRAHRECFSRMLSTARDRGAGMSILYALPRLAIARKSRDPLAVMVATAATSAATTKMIKAGHAYAAAYQLTSLPPNRNSAMRGKAATTRPQLR